MKRITEDWLIFGVQDTKYGHFVVSNLDKRSAGEYPELKIRAEASFIHTLKTTTFDGLFTGSRTANEYFRLLSEQSGIQMTVETFKEAFGWEKFGEGVHNIREFTRGLNNYGYVYEPISENEIALKDRIGRDVQFVIKNAMNADNMQLSIDRSQVFTQADGYGDFEEGDNYYKTAGVKDQYTSPLASIIGIKRAETYKNQNIKHKDTMRRYLEDIVDNSVKFNLSTNFYKIRNYPFAVPRLGDRIRVQDESINLNSIAKLIKLVTRYDPYGDVYDYELTFGSLDIGQRARSTISQVSRLLQDLINGRETLDLSSLDASTRAMIADFKSAQTEIIIGDYSEGIQGIFLVEKDDPNRAVGLTSKGIVLTENGFAGGIEENLAISPRAINASLIRAGALYLEQFLGIEGKDGWLLITGDEFKATSKDNPDKFVSITAEGAHFRNGFIRISTSSGRDVMNDGYILRNPAVSWTYPHSFGPDVRQGDGEFSKNYFLTSSDQYQTGGFFSFSHESRYLRVYVTLNTLSSSPAARARLRMLNNYSNEIRTTESDDLEYGSRLLMDIGEPLDYGVRRYAYVEFRKEGEGDTVAGLRINTREQTDFP